MLVYLLDYNFLKQITVFSLMQYPHSSKVEHSADNRETVDRYHLWVPNCPVRLAVRTSPFHGEGQGFESPTGYQKRAVS